MHQISPIFEWLVLRHSHLVCAFPDLTRNFGSIDEALLFVEHMLDTVQDLIDSVKE